MKRILNLILFQAILSLVSGILFSQMSFIGKIGISMTNNEYSVLKTWWKGALIIFGVQLFLIVILGLNRKLNNYKSFLIIDLVLIIIGLLGLGYTYWDFTQTSHKYMDTLFHWGGYLAWLGWFISCLYFLFFSLKPKSPSTVKVPKKEEEKSIYPPINDDPNQMN